MSTDQATPAPEGTLPPSKAPASTGLLPLLGVLEALGCLALGVVGLHDGLVYADALDGQPWVERVVAFVDNRAAQTWMVFAGAAAILAGLWLVYQAVSPRARREVQLQARTGVFLTAGSLRSISTAAAQDVDSVERASVSASKRRVDVDATTWARDHDAVKAAVTAEVAERLSVLTKPPRIDVSTTQSGVQE